MAGIILQQAIIMLILNVVGMIAYSVSYTHLTLPTIA